MQAQWPLNTSPILKQGNSEIKLFGVNFAQCKNLSFIMPGGRRLDSVWIDYTSREICAFAQIFNLLYLVSIPLIIDVNLYKILVYLYQSVCICTKYHESYLSAFLLICLILCELVPIWLYLNGSVWICIHLRRRTPPTLDGTRRWRSSPHSFNVVSLPRL